MNNSECAHSPWGGCVTATPSPVQNLVWTEKSARALQRPSVPAPHQDQLGSPRPSLLWERRRGVVAQLGLRLEAFPFQLHPFLTV